MFALTERADTESLFPIHKARQKLNPSHRGGGSMAVSAKMPQ
jgi:hypothetical protein